jgi:hypothetical protein
VGHVTEAEARADAARRNAETGASGLWAAQRTPAGEWRVVHLVGPGLARRWPAGAHVESKPKPPDPADPRPAVFRNVPPFGGA